MTISQLATEMGLSDGMVSKIENGQVSPSLSSLQSLSRALSVPLTAFFKASNKNAPLCMSKRAKGSRRNVRAHGRGTRLYNAALIRGGRVSAHKKGGAPLLGGRGPRLFTTGF